MTVHICWTAPQRTLATRSAEVRWCFACRKRVEFTDTCTADVGPSYYEPNWTRRCPRGHVDGDVGFGRAREWA